MTLTALDSLKLPPFDKSQQRNSEVIKHKHGRSRSASGSPACFCAPRHPWEKGTNESAHGLLRDFFPTGRSLDGATDAEVNAAYAMLNRRPRKHLGWK